VMIKMISISYGIHKNKFYCFMCLTFYYQLMELPIFVLFCLAYKKSQKTLKGLSGGEGPLSLAVGRRTF
jgi:hypothetical protein